MLVIILSVTVPALDQSDGSISHTGQDTIKRTDNIIGASDFFFVFFF